MGPVPIVMLFELVECVAEMALVPDEGPVQEFVAKCLHPPLHNRIHSRHPNAAEDNLYASVGENLVEELRELRVPVPNHVLSLGASVVKVHHQVLRSLGYPAGGRMRSGAKDPHAAAGVLHDGEDVLALAGQGHGLDDIAGQQCIGLGAQEGCPGGARSVWGGVDAFDFKDLPDSGRGDLDAKGGEFTMHSP